MNEPTSPETSDGSGLSLFKRHENLTVTAIFVSFVIVIAVLQVIISGGGTRPSSAR